MARLSLVGLGLAMAWLLMAVLLVAPARADVPQGATVTIRIENVQQARGMLRLGLYDAALYAKDNAEPVAAADVKAVAGETVITLHNVPPGTYAIEMFQDLNSNGKMDQNWFGYPLEPFGFSRDAKPHLHKPHFADVSFTVGQGENLQSLSLQTSVSLIAAE
jgi:uncharacterized protein (DUF2141 family)